MTIKSGLRKALEVVGNGYSIKMIDFEQCLYKDLGEYEIEVSGLNNNKTKNRKIIAFVWAKKPSYKIVYRTKAINSIDTLRDELIDIESEYSA